MAEESHDDQSVPGDTELWRRIPNWPNRVVYDENLGRVRPSSANFDDHPNGTPMSVAIADGIVTHQEVLRDHPSFYLVGFTVGQIRDVGLGILRRPLVDQPWHGEVTGRKSASVKSRLARQSFWIIAPT